MAILMLFMEVHYGLAGDWLEDFIYGDLDKSYGNKGIGLKVIMDNWPDYIAQIICIPVLSIIQVCCTGTLFRNNFEMEQISLAKMPIEYIPLNFEQIDAHSHHMIFAATLIFNLATLYYQIEYLSKFETVEKKSKI